MKNTINIFVDYLDLLGVKYSKSSSSKYFNEHPHKNNLYGLSVMLSNYGIRNAATRIKDKENDIFNIECPFIAHLGGIFVVVYKVTSDKIYYLWDGKKIVVLVSDFIKSWTGIILLAEVSSDSIEPDYAKYRKKDLLNIVQQIILALAGVAIFGLAYIHQHLFSELGITLLLMVNLIGVYICYLLVLKQLDIHSQYADKICSLFSKSDCNNVLESDAAKLWGVFGWSEIGLGYFTANVFVLLFFPHLIHWLAIINILALPYTVWSIWYQKFKARQWCPLCLIVQVLLWCIFMLDGLFGYIQIPDFELQDILLTGCLYVIPIFTFNLILPRLSEGNQMEQLRQEINSIKTNEDVFRTLLTQQPYFEVSEADSQILFGNPNAVLKVTILTNPFCNPCAKMHARIETLLRETKEKGNVCIQYIFSAFDESLEYANRYLNAVYIEKDETEAIQIFDNWFRKGKLMKEAFFDGLQLDITNPVIETEFLKHEAWKEKTQLRETPTILANGFKLPDNYKIEDLRYITEFNVDIK